MRKSKLLSLILALAMIVSVVPVGAFAAGTEDIDPNFYITKIGDVTTRKTSNNTSLATVYFKKSNNYNLKLVAENAPADVEWQIDGNFPKGMGVSKDGFLTYSPTKDTESQKSEDIYAKVLCIDKSNNKNRAQLDLSWIVYDDNDKPQINTSELPKGMTHSKYNNDDNGVKIDIKSLFSGCTCTISKGKLPVGLSLEKIGLNWYIKGTPTEAGTFNFTLKAESAAGSTEKELTLVVDEKNLISNITANVTAPEVGNEPDFTNITCGKNANYTAKIKNWYSVGLGAPGEMKPGDKFEAGKYRVEIGFYAKSGYEFSNDATATVNGEKGTLGAYTAGDIGKIYIECNVTFEIKDENEPVTISNANAIITEPKAGQKPSMTAKAADSTYTAEVISWHKCSNEYGASDSNKMGADEVFEAGTNYTAKVKFTPVGKNSFGGYCIFKINGANTVDKGDNIKAKSFTATSEASFPVPTKFGEYDFTYNESASPKYTTSVLFKKGQEYSMQFSATGGEEPYTWLTVSGMEGAVISKSGLFTYNPAVGIGTTRGYMSLACRDKNNKKTDFWVNYIVYDDKDIPSITTTELNNGTINNHYNFIIESDGYNFDKVWSLESGTLPEGLALESNGCISGTPTKTGTSNFSVKVKNPLGSNTKKFSLTIDEPTITTVSATITGFEAGKTPNDTEITAGAATYTAEVAQWYRGNNALMVDEIKDKMNASDKFEAGKSYVVEVHFYPVGTNSFSSSISAKINDEKGSLNGNIEKNGKMSRAVLTIPASSSIPSVPSDLYGYNKLTSENDKKAYAVMLDGLEKGKTEIDISAFSLSNDETKRLITIIRNDNPQLYRLNNNYLLKTSSTTKKVSSYNPSYSTFSFDDAKFDSAVNELLKAANGKTTEYDKAVAIHDALVKHITYEESPNQFNAYGAIADKKAVCEGYAKAYQYLLRKLGIQSYIVTGTSKEQNHGWNLVKLDGKYYHVDVTWDDPTVNPEQEAGKPIYHAYFAVSDSDIEVDHYILTDEITLDKANERKLYNLSLVEGELTVDKIAKTFTKNGSKAIAKIYYTGTGNMETFLKANLNDIVKASPVKPAAKTTVNYSNCGREWIIEYDADTETEVPHTHNLRLVAGRAPTCKLDGWLDYYECDCGKYFKDAEGKAEIPNLEEWKTGEGKLNKVDHSLGEWQKDETNHWKVCGTCGDKFETANHTYGEWTTVTEPTETTAGLKKHSCSICGYEETEVIPAIGHTHSFGEEWKHDENNHWHECSCGEKSDTAKHTYKWVIDKAATGTEAGSKHEECTVCGYKKANVVIPATDAVYTVKHMKEKLDALETYEVFEEETLTGKIGENTKANAKEYGGFVPQAVTQSKITEDGKTVVEIKYDRKRATFKFKANGGEGTMEDLVFVFGETKKLPANTFTLEGYSFTGWNDASDGSGELSFADKDETAFNNGGLADNTVITLYAQWEKNVVYYDVTFDLNGGTKGPSFGKHTATVPEGQLIDFAKMPDDFVIAPAGKQLAGLKINGTNYPVTAKYTVTSDTTVKFLWEDKSPVAEKHSINMYDDGDGSAAASLSKAEKDEIVEIKATADSGYKFSHWEVLKGNAKLDNAKSSETYFEMPDENVYIKAHFEKKSSKPAPSGGSHSNSSAREEERDFWNEVIDKIEHASKKETVKADAKDYTKMPWPVMEALKKNPTVTLVIERNGGKDIIIPAGKTLPIEGNRVYYQLSYLAEVYKNVDINNNVRPVPGIINPPTGANLF